MTKEVDFDNEPQEVKEDIIKGIEENTGANIYDNFNNNIKDIKMLEMEDDLKDDLVRIKSEKFFQREEMIENAKVHYLDQLNRSIDSFFHLRESTKQINEMHPGNINEDSIVFHYSNIIKLMEFLRLKVRIIFDHNEIDITDSLDHANEILEFMNSYDSDDWQDFFPTKIIRASSKALAIHEMILLDEELREKVYGIAYLSNKKLEIIKIKNEEEEE